MPNNKRPMICCLLHRRPVVRVVACSRRRSLSVRIPIIAKGRAADQFAQACGAGYNRTMTTKTRRKGTELPEIALVPAEMAAPPDAAAREQLRQVLLQQKLPQLRAMAAARQVTARGNQREPLVDALLDNLLDPVAQAAIVAGLGQPARALLAVGLVLDWMHNNVTSPDAQRVL